MGPRGNLRREHGNPYYRRFEGCVTLLAARLRRPSPRACVDAHSIKGADVPGEQRAALIVAEIERGERLCRIGFHRRTESMVAQDLTTEMVDRKKGHRRHAR